MERLKDFGNQLSHRIFNKLFYLKFLQRKIKEEGISILLNPQFRDFLNNQERRIGMLEGAIISDAQFLPIDAENTTFTYKIERVNNFWIGVDYLRASQLGKNNNKIREGALSGYLLNEIRNKSKDDYTPTFLLDIFDIDHATQFEFPSLDKLIHGEYVEPISYSEALRKVGQYDKLAYLIHPMNIADKEVYQVTPKGNGLLSLESQ